MLPNEFVYQSLTANISLESVLVTLSRFITVYHWSFKWLRLLRRTQNNMQNVTIVESYETYGKFNDPVQYVFSFS